MRRATAVRRLRTIAERCGQVCHLWEPDAGLVGVHTFGGVLDPSDEDGSIEVIQIVLVVREDPDQVTWCSRPPTFSGLPYVLDLEKAPVDWYFRPAGHPVGNHRIVRPLAIWSREDGMHEAALDALAQGDADALDRLREPLPRPAVLQRQVAEELGAAAAHLRRVRDQYWARGWRKAHHAAGTYPENYLWDAVNGYLDLRAAADGLPGGSVVSIPGRVTPTRPAVTPTRPAPAGPIDQQSVLPVPPDAVGGAAGAAEPGAEPRPGPMASAAPEEVALAAVSERGTARRTRRATVPARSRGTRGASPDS